MLVISVFILIALLEGLRAAVPYWEYLLGGGFILAWMLGVRYERQVIVEAGVAEEGEVRLAERNASNWLIQGEDPEDPRA